MIENAGLIFPQIVEFTGRQWNWRKSKEFYLEQRKTDLPHVRRYFNNWLRKRENMKIMATGKCG